MNKKQKVPPESVFNLGNRRKEKVHKQDEIDIPNAIPDVWGTQATIFHHSRWVCAGSCRVREGFWI